MCPTTNGLYLFIIIGLAVPLASNQIRPSFAMKWPTAPSHSIQCERLEFEFCSTMPFNATRMPNFFGDKNQIEASERSKQYELLVRSRCSHHLHDYLCELLAPMCLKGEAMKKFEIYPCRSFCRQIRRDCDHQLLTIFGQSLNLAFACDQLPYESNGGDGKLHGPCHDTPESPLAPGPQSNDKYNNKFTVQQHLKQQQQQQSSSANRELDSNYWPYQPSLDNPNIPPFITDTTGIELDIINQNAKQLSDNNNNKQQNDPQQPSETQQSAIPVPIPTTAPTSGNLVSKLHSLGQSLANTLLQYSNLITLLTIVCLVGLIFRQQIKRIKSRLISPSSSSQTSGSSTVSSSGSKRKLATASSGAYPPIGGVALANAHKVTLSPSSSSRSLMLFAGGGGGGVASSKQQHLQHKLISAAELAAAGAGPGPGLRGSGEPSQQLLHGLNQKTLIDVDGSFERRNYHNRYHLMQGANSASLINPTSHHHSHYFSKQMQPQQHEYDYIQVTGGQPVAQQLDGSASIGRYHNYQESRLSSSTKKQRHQFQESPQLVKNILLSSPSHQVLLIGNTGAAGDAPPTKPRSITASRDAAASQSSSSGSSARLTTHSNSNNHNNNHHHHHRQQQPPPPPHDNPAHLNYPTTSPHYATASLINSGAHQSSSSPCRHPAQYHRSQ